MDNDGTVSLVDTITRRAIGRFTVHGQDGIIDAVRRDDVRFSPDGARLAVGGERPVIVDARTRQVLARLPGGPMQFTYAVRFDPDGRTLLAARRILRMADDRD